MLIRMIFKEINQTNLKRRESLLISNKALLSIRNKEMANHWRKILWITETV